MSYTLSQEAISFFMHSYFGITLAELEDRDEKSIIIKCAKRAYLDLSRTLNFAEKPTNNMKSDEKKKIEEDHSFFRDKVCGIIEEICEKLLESTEENFDANHKKACEEICIIARESKALAEIEHAKEHIDEKNEKFYYGQAQKWLNMTLKYMWLIGFWKDKFEKLLPILHIPVDSFVIEAVWHENLEENKNGRISAADVENLNVKLPCVKEDTRRYKYANEKVVSWSKWNYDEYNSFQKSLRKWCTTKPLIWEGQAWIDIANKRSSK